jgi:hypothetical protein
MKVVKRTGLVPVYEPKNSSHIFGVSPEAAIEGVNNKILVLVDEQVLKDAEVETFDYVVPGSTGKAKDAKDDADEAGPILIPADWETQHYMKNIQIAETIKPGMAAAAKAAGKSAKDAAEEIIKTELARRAAQDPGALGTQSTQ